jgi:hypothetical protein
MTPFTTTETYRCFGVKYHIFCRDDGGNKFLRNVGTTNQPTRRCILEYNSLRVYSADNFKPSILFYFILFFKSFHFGKNGSVKDEA